MRRKNRGMLLVEAAFAAALLLLFFNAVVFTGTSQMRWSRSYGEKSFANQILESKLADMKADFSTWSGGNTRTETQSRNEVEFTIARESQVMASGLIMLKCVVTWEKGSQDFRVADQVLLSDRE